MTLKDGTPLESLLAQADAEVDVTPAEKLLAEIGDEDLVVIDIRDVRELEREGHLPGAVHMPRGMLEFWISPDSPYTRPVFQEDKRFVFYCALGQRSALACQVAVRLGLQNASHLPGGFAGWKEAGGEVVPYERKKKK